jgi:formylglycine-generating enzyme required for sulfatase activity
MKRFPLAALLLLSWLGMAHAAATDQSQDDVRAEIAQQLGPEHSFALVIGVSDYDKGWRDLSGVDNEVLEIAGALEQQGFTIVRPGSAGHLTVGELRKAILDFIRAYGSAAENRLIIYVASHGAAALRDGTSMGFLVASDTPRQRDPAFASQAYSVNELADALLGVASQHVFIFFNACFSGAMVPDITRGETAADRVAPISASPLSEEVAQWTLELLSHNARLVLTAGSDGQEVPDRDNPFAKSIIRGLMGEADTDADGLILGTELAQFVRGQVARETRAIGAANDPVFAVLPKVTAPPKPRPDQPAAKVIDYRLQGDYVFLSPRGPGQVSAAGDVTVRRNARLMSNQFTDCADCPVMVTIPGQNYAMANTETTLAAWDACYRELGCRRWIDDEGLGRGDRPAQGIDWADAQEFIQWLNTKPSRRCAAYRLPTEREWRNAALAGSRSAFPWGDDLGNARAVCWGCGDGMDGWSPARTASLPANAYGLSDMVGNLWEWTEDKEAACPLASLLATGACKDPGTVMGGAYSTRDMTAIPRGQFARSIGLSLPTIGVRAACVLRE